MMIELNPIIDQYNIDMNNNANLAGLDDKSELLVDVLTGLGLLWRHDDSA